MTVLDLRKILIGCKIVYKDRFTNEIIDYNNINRRERNMFKNRNIYLMYPKEDKMIVVLF